VKNGRDPGRKIVKDLLHLLEKSGMSDREFTEEAGLSSALPYSWRRRLKDGKPMYPRYPTVEAACNALGLTLTITKRNW